MNGAGGQGACGDGQAVERGGAAHGTCECGVARAGRNRQHIGVGRGAIDRAVKDDVGIGGGQGNVAHDHCRAIRLGSRGRDVGTQPHQRRSCGCECPSDGGCLARHALAQFQLAGGVEGHG